LALGTSGYRCLCFKTKKVVGMLCAFSCARWIIDDQMDDYSQEMQQIRRNNDYRRWLPNHITGGLYLQFIL
jgi:hypothetical protein